MTGRSLGKKTALVVELTASRSTNEYDIDDIQAYEHD
jgi:hypothetical protein